MAPDSASLPLPLQQYQNGVIKATRTTCDPQYVDHVVLLVGFGKTKSVEGRQAKDISGHSHRHSTPYWILKNSWGANWGEKVSVILGQNRAGLSPPSSPALMSSDFLGLFPAAPREQCLWYHQVPGYCPSGYIS